MATFALHRHIQNISPPLEGTRLPAVWCVKETAEIRRELREGRHSWQLLPSLSYGLLIQRLAASAPETRASRDFQRLGLFCAPPTSSSYLLQVQTCSGSLNPVGPSNIFSAVIEDLEKIENFRKKIDATLYTADVNYPDTETSKCQPCETFEEKIYTDFIETFKNVAQRCNRETKN
ncbi:interleukin-15 isoform X2 [Rhineura floridana]|uniref:interleukin-15 isoform X2 n=1 Tax=Rhineura floridana TaxID=261503 RepID=UPI002AC85857|nr:interleukin-15 isoform X2 [Rhineura floridana]